MEWTTCDAALLTEAFNGTELAKVVQARSQDEADPVPGICAGIAARCREAAAASGRVSLAGKAADTIPTALRGEAVALLRYKLLVRYDLSVTEDRRREAEAAEARLDAVARGEVPMVEGTAQSKPTFHGRPQRWNSPKHGGII